MSLSETENAIILKQKLQSKTEALRILTHELERVRIEAEDYKELTRRRLYGSEEDRSFRDRTSVVSRHFSQLRDENKKLIADRDALRIQVKEKEEEAKVIRQQRLKELQDLKNDVRETSKRDQSENRERERTLLSELESLQVKYNVLKRDLQSLLDEKEDLIQDRDAFKCKSDRLNHSLNALLKSGGYKGVLDMDCLLSENRFLQQRLQQVQDEKDLANEMGRRYKSALERNKEPIRDAGGGVGVGGSGVVNKELERLISQTSFPCPPNVDLNDPKSLHELCLTLLETLNDRMTQLKTQRKANKCLSDRLAYLQDKIVESNNNTNGELLVWPSQYLMKGYNPAAEHDSSKSFIRSNDDDDDDDDQHANDDDDDDDDVSVEIENLFKKFRNISAKSEEILERPRDPVPTTLSNEEEENDLPPHLKALVMEAMINRESQENI